MSQYLDVYDDSDFLDYVDDFYAMHKVDVPVGRYTSCTANINTFGHMLIQLCSAHNVYIGNGRKGKDKFIWKQTCKNSTVIDYFILSSNVFQFVNEFEVMNFDPMLSDVHSPIHISFCVKETENLNFSNDVSTSSNVNKNVIKWKSERK